MLLENERKKKPTTITIITRKVDMQLIVFFFFFLNQTKQPVCLLMTIVIRKYKRSTIKVCVYVLCMYVFKCVHKIVQ